MSRSFSQTSKYSAVRFINRFYLLERINFPTDIIFHILNFIPSCIVLVVNNTDALIKYRCKNFKKTYYTGYLHKNNINVLSMGIGDKFKLASGKSTIIRKHSTIYVTTPTKFNIDPRVN